MKRRKRRKERVGGALVRFLTPCPYDYFHLGQDCARLLNRGAKDSEASLEREEVQEVTGGRIATRGWTRKEKTRGEEEGRASVSQQPMAWPVGEVLVVFDDVRRRRGGREAR